MWEDFNSANQEFLTNLGERKAMTIPLWVSIVTGILGAMGLNWWQEFRRIKK
jgi:cytoskeletal protein RodZ